MFDGTRSLYLDVVTEVVHFLENGSQIVISLVSDNSTVGHQRYVDSFDERKLFESIRDSIGT